MGRDGECLEGGATGGCWQEVGGGERIVGGDEGGPPGGMFERGVGPMGRLETVEDEKEREDEGEVPVVYCWEELEKRTRLVFVLRSHG